MAKNRILPEKTYATIVRARRFFKRMDIGLNRLLLPGFFAFCGSLCEGALYWLLIVVLKGLFEGSFRPIADTRFIGHVFQPIVAQLDKPQPIIFTVLILFVFLAVVFKNLFNFASAVLTSSITTNLTNSLRKQIFSRYLKFGKLFFDNNGSGYLFELIAGFTRRISNELKVMEQSLFQFFSFLVCFSLMAVISWQLTIAVIFIFPIYHYSTSWIMRRIKKSSYQLVSFISDLSKKISGALLCIPLIRTYNTKDREQMRFNSASDKVRMCEYNIDKKRAFVAPLEEISLVSMALVLIAAMAFLIMREKTGDVAGYMVFFLLLRRNAGNMAVFNKIRLSLSQVSGMLEQVAFIFNDEDKYFIPEGKVEFTGLKNNIELKDLSFSYPNKETVLRGISLSIPKGKTTAIIGATGSGKTTLINLILRLYDAAPGTIYLDGTDIRAFTLDSLYKSMAFISQDVFIFDDSIRYNITYGLKAEPSKEYIENILDKARLSDFVKKLPQGLETQVGDRGIKLSGGEKQRIAIARAMFKNVEIIILDEATSSLDSITERMIQEALEALAKDKTAIVIAHRLSTIEKADNIVVLEEGMIREQGKLNDLLGAKGKFYEYWQAQKFR